MIAADAGRARAVARTLLAGAGPELYARNPFRLTGLSTSASRREVRRRRQRASAVLDVGDRPGTDRILPPKHEVSRTELAVAFDEIADAEARLVAELFWWWDVPGADCGCPEGLHAEHDQAVRAHAEALDAVTDDAVTVEWCDELWRMAGVRWSALLDVEAFWGHVAHRVRALDDRRIDSSTVDGIRSALGSALIRPLLELAENAEHPREFVARLPQWDLPGAVVRDELESIVERQLTRVRSVRKDVLDTLADGRTVDAGRLGVNTLAVETVRLEEMAPYRENRRSAVERDQVAVALNNCAAPLIESRPPNARSLPRKLLAHALDFAVRQETRRQVVRNGFAEFRTGRLVVLREGGRHKRAVELLLDWLDEVDGAADPELHAEILRLLEERRPRTPSKPVPAESAEPPALMSAGGLVVSVFGAFAVAVLVWVSLALSGLGVFPVVLLGLAAGVGFAVLASLVPRLVDRWWPRP